MNDSGLGCVVMSYDFMIYGGSFGFLLLDRFVPSRILDRLIACIEGHRLTYVSER